MCTTLIIILITLDIDIILHILYNYNLPFHSFGNGQTSGTNSEVNRLYETVDTRMFAPRHSDERYTQSETYHEDAGEKKEELK